MRWPFVPALIIGLSLAFGTTLFAEPAAQPSVSEKKPAAKSKTKEKAPQARVEGSYSSEAEAKKACTDGAVVWVNSRSKIYHAAGTRDYGKTREGFYMCQPQADRSGFRAVKGSQKKKDGKK